MLEALEELMSRGAMANLTSLMTSKSEFKSVLIESFYEMACSEFRGAATKKK
jgi:hypothetical protein